MVNIYGGGAKTNIVGLRFEQDTSLEAALISAGYIILDDKVLDTTRKIIAIIGSKNKLYKNILEPNGIKWNEILSKRLLPDDALYNIETNTVYIIEKKFQHQAGSVDEKLQTCAFKKEQYQKLFAPMKASIEYIYVCNDWFTKNEYRDVREYIVNNGCHIYFNEIPLEFLAL